MTPDDVVARANGDLVDIQPAPLRIEPGTHTRSRPFDNRIGVVVTNNLGEVGVGFGFDWAIQLPGVEAWFLPTELERVR